MSLGSSEDGGFGQGVGGSDEDIGMSICRMCVCLLGIHCGLWMIGGGPLMLIS